MATFPQTLVKGDVTRVVTDATSAVAARFDGYKPADAGNGRPAGNAGHDVWHGYALSQGYTEDDLVDLGRDGIRDLFKD